MPSVHFRRLLPYGLAFFASIILGLAPARSTAADAAKPKKKDTSAVLRPKEATFTTKVAPAEAAPGETVTYTVTVKLARGWHIYAYAAKQPDSGPRQTQFDFFNAAGLKPVGAWKPDKPPIRKHDKAFPEIKELEYYEPEVSWSIDLKVPPDAAAGKKVLRNQIYFQICDPNSCKPPAYVTLPDAELTVKPGGAASLGPRGAALAALLAVGITDTPAGAAKPKRKDTRLRPEEAAFTTEVEPAEAAPGATVTYTVTAKLEPGWHIYAQADKQAPNGQPRKTVFDFFDTAGLEPVGAWKPDRQPIRKHDPGFPNIKFVEFHEDRVSWSRELKVPADAAPGKKTLRNQVNFQICDPNSCKPPAYVTLPDAELTVKPGGAASLGRDDAALAAAMTIAVTDTPNVGTKPGGPAKNSVNAAIDRGLLPFLLLSAGSGLLALLMPCVWPMVPITVNFFVKQGHANKGKTTGLAITYCLAIIGVYTLLGLLVTIFLGGTATTALGNNPWINALFGVVFILLALSLLGLFEIRLPSFLLNASAQRESRGGLIGVIFMALTLTITSFTCTAPLVGSLLVLASHGQYFYPVVGLLTFSTVLALPFFIMAMVPGLLSSMPRSGDWMNTVKVVGALLEIGAAFKFINTAEVSFARGNVDQVWIDAQVLLAIWVVLALVCGLYLLGLFKTSHDHDAVKVGPGRLLTGSLFLMVALYLAPALFGYPPHSKFYEAIAGLLPPDAAELDATNRISERVVASISDQLGTAALAARQPDAGNGGGAAERAVKATSSDPKVAEREQKDHHGVLWGLSYEAALEQAKATRRPVLIDFTGQNCAVCRTMERTVFPKPPVVEQLKRFVTVQLYTDFVPLATIPDDDRENLAVANQERQQALVGQVSSPLYVVVDENGKVIDQAGFDRVGNAPAFVKYLKDAVSKFEAASNKVAASG